MGNIVSYIKTVSRKKFSTCSELHRVSWVISLCQPGLSFHLGTSTLLSSCLHLWVSHLQLHRKPVLSEPHLASIRVWAKRLLPAQPGQAGRPWGRQGPSATCVHSVRCIPTYRWCVYHTHMCVLVYMDHVCGGGCIFLLGMHVWSWCRLNLGTQGCHTSSVVLMASAAPCQNFTVCILKALRDESHFYLVGGTFFYGTSLWISISSPFPSRFCVFSTELHQPFQYAL